MKVCFKCKIEKPIKDFNINRNKKDGFEIYCRPCVKINDAIKYQRNAYAIKERSKKWARNHKEIVNERARKNYEKNPEEIKKRSRDYNFNNKEKISTNKKRYYFENKETIIKKQIKYNAARLKTDLNFKIKITLSTRIRSALKNANATKKNRTIEYLGISIPEFRKHMEKQFYINPKTNEMMSWENIGKWHIDHIIPCASYDLTDIKAQKKCFHYTNLRPLWAEENLKKGAKFII